MSRYTAVDDERTDDAVFDKMLRDTAVDDERTDDGVSAGNDIFSDWKVVNYFFFTDGEVNAFCASEEVETAATNDVDAAATTSEHLADCLPDMPVAAVNFSIRFICFCIKST